MGEHVFGQTDRAATSLDLAERILEELSSASRRWSVVLGLTRQLSALAAAEEHDRPTDPPRGPHPGASGRVEAITEALQ